MNIFVLDENCSLAAKYHCNKHVVKMISESAQMLSTAHRVLDGKKTLIGYSAKQKPLYRLILDNPVFDSTFCKETHNNHPCAKWARESSDNYLWLWYLFRCLLQEYTDRYQKHHAYESLLFNLRTLPKNLSAVGATPHPLAMPDKYKTDSAVESYRNYYFGEKRHFCKWKEPASIPTWFQMRLDQEHAALL